MEVADLHKPVELNVTLRGRQIDGSKISAKMPYLMPYLGAFFKYDSTGLSITVARSNLAWLVLLSVRVSVYWVSG